VAKELALTQHMSSKEDSIGSPYLVARREWDERYGGLIKRAQQWRGAAVLALLVALAEAIVIVGVATRPRTTPYVVAVDSLGRVAAAGAVDRTSTVDERMKPYFVLQKRRQVVKKNPWLRIIGHFANQLFQIIHSNGSPWSSFPRASISSARPKRRAR